MLKKLLLPSAMIFFVLLSFSHVYAKKTKGIRICNTQLSPVCGTDNITYKNKCIAQMRGVDIAYEGECKICFDTDNGTNIYEAGEVRIGQQIFRDYCEEDYRTMYEAECFDDAIKYTKYVCEAGCLYGKCLENTVPEITVSYPNGGEIIYKDMDDAFVAEAIVMPYNPLDTVLFELIDYNTGEVVPYNLNGLTNLSQDIIWIQVINTANLPVGDYIIKTYVYRDDELLATDTSNKYFSIKESNQCFDNTGCSSDYFCSLNNCMAETGVCRPRPETCVWIYQPVCGCNDKTYSNECVALQNGVNVYHEGECDD